MDSGHLLTRFEDAGIVREGDLPADTRVTCIIQSRTVGPEGPVLELLGLVEGLDDMGVGRFLLRWNLRQGIPASVLGGPFAMRLPLVLARVDNAEAVRVLTGLTDSDGLVLHGTALEAWQRGTAPAATRPDQRLARKATPSRADLECWEALRLAADVGGVPQPVQETAQPGR